MSSKLLSIRDMYLKLLDVIAFFPEIVYKIAKREDNLLKIAGG